MDLTIVEMRRLILVRHAKSKWPEGIEDFERPLAKRGKKDAKKMATFLKEKDLEIDLLLSSPARRALKTCKIFHETFDNAKLETEEDLYEAHKKDFINSIIHISDDYKSVALFSHNNGISSFAEHCLKNKEIFLPTCGVIGIDINIDSWKDFNENLCKFSFLYIPKELK